MSLKGKAALVTGSTSGIGLAIAQAFAAEGCSIMLNGFGEAAAIHRLRDEMAAKSGVKVAYHAADMSKPAEIADLVADTQAKLGGVDILVNNAGIQHVARVENFPPDKWDAIIADQSQRLVPHHPRRAAVDEAEGLGPHHQHRQHARPRRLDPQDRLRGGQARPDRPHQGHGHRMRRHRRHLQCDLSWLRVDAAGAGPDRGAGEGRQASPSSRQAAC